MLAELFAAIKQYWQQQQGELAVASRYEVIAHEENFENSNKLHVKVRVRGVNKTFYRPIEDLYQKQWLENFSREDAAFLAVLYFAEKSHDPAMITRFPTRKKMLSKNVIVLSMFFVSFLIMSNLSAAKVVAFNMQFLPFVSDDFTLIMPAALVFFPMTYFFDDTLTEVYGFKVSRLVIWSSLGCICLVMLGIMLTVKLPAAAAWPHQHAYALVFTNSLRVFAASVLAYVIGEFLNSVILSKLKVLTSGRWLWLRVLTSTSVAVAIDSMIFCHLTFWGILAPGLIWRMIVTQYVLKVSYEVMVLPLTYVLTGYLKKVDNIDYYDYKTKFNPFSFKLDD